MPRSTAESIPKGKTGFQCQCEANNEFSESRFANDGSGLINNLRLYIGDLHVAEMERGRR